MPSKKDAQYWRDYRARKAQEVSMDDNIKKAIEPDKIRQTPRGRLTKGLGDVPGLTRQADNSGEREVDPSMSQAWSRSQPVPKK